MLKRYYENLKEISPNILPKVFVYCIALILVTITLAIIYFIYAISFESLFNPSSSNQKTANLNDSSNVKIYSNPKLRDTPQKESYEEKYQAFKLDSLKLKSGLPISSESQFIPPRFVLATLFDKISEHLFALLCLIISYYILPTFSKTANQWRLVLNISLLLILIGAYFVAIGVTSSSNIKIYTFLEMASSSTGLFFALFGSVLTYFSIKKIDKK